LPLVIPPYPQQVSISIKISDAACFRFSLLVIGRYLIWIRQNKEFKDVLIRDFNAKEVELRKHPELHEVYDEDKEALAEFRRTGDLGEFVVKEGDTDTASPFSTAIGGSTTLKSRRSKGSSIGSIPSKVSNQASLESINEEDPTIENGSEGSDLENGTHHSTPSPPERRRTVVSSAHTDTSVSTLGQSTMGQSTMEQSLGSGINKRDDDESTAMLMTQ
jgi:hypothetical protein